MSERSCFRINCIDFSPRYAAICSACHYAKTEKTFEVAEHRLFDHAMKTHGIALTIEKSSDVMGPP